MSTVDFDTTPHPRFLRGLQNLKWTGWEAIAELIDNSFDLDRGNASSVHLIHHPRGRLLSVLDNGQGMTTVGDLFKMGATIGLKPGNIGQYGNGGKLALLWLGSDVRVTTLRDGRVSTAHAKWSDWWRLDVFPLLPLRWERASLSNTPSQLLPLEHGTLVEIKLSSKHSFGPSNIRRDLSLAYGPGLRRGKQIKWTTVARDTESIELAEDAALGEPLETIPIDGVLESDGEHLPITGYVGRYDGISQRRSHVAIGFINRVILRTRDCYASLDGEEKYVGVGIAGYIDLGEGWQRHLSTQKNAIDDATVRNALMEWLFTRIRPILRKVEEREMAIEFRDLALQLERALNDRGHPVDVVLASPDDNGDLLIGDGDLLIDGDGRGEGKRKDPRQPAAEDEDGSKKAKGDQDRHTKIRILPMTDVAMDGVLAKAIPNKAELAIGVNREHEIVREAMKAKPVNRMALNLLITREMAEALAADDRLLQAAFPPRIRRLIPENGLRIQTIQRLLIDRTRDMEEVTA